MAQWSTSFDTIMASLELETVNFGELFAMIHAFIKSLKYEGSCMIFMEIPGEDEEIFGAHVVFVNNEVLTKLQWSFAEWENGTASQGVLAAEEAERIRLYLITKSNLPMLARIRKKTTPQNQSGDPYVLHFRHDLPHNLRLTVGVPA